MWNSFLVNGFLFDFFQERRNHNLKNSKRLFFFAGLHADIGYILIITTNIFD